MEVQSAKSQGTGCFRPCGVCVDKAAAKGTDSSLPTYLHPVMIVNEHFTMMRRRENFNYAPCYWYVEPLAKPTPALHRLSLSCLCPRSSPRYTAHFNGSSLGTLCVYGIHLIGPASLAPLAGSLGDAINHPKRLFPSEEPLSFVLSRPSDGTTDDPRAETQTLRVGRECFNT